LARIITACLFHKRKEALSIQLVGLEPDDVTGRARDKHPVAERSAQVRDINLDVLRSCRRWSLTPEGVDEPIHRDNFVAVEQQDCEQGARLARRKVESVAVPPDLERSQNLELEALRHAIPDAARNPRSTEVNRCTTGEEQRRRRKATTAHTPEKGDRMQRHANRVLVSLAVVLALAGVTAEANASRWIPG